MESDTESHDIELKILPTPVFEGGEACAVQQGAGMVVIKATEDEEKACVEFLKWFTKAENNIAFSVGSGYLPVTKEANDMKKIKDLKGNPLLLWVNSWSIGMTLDRNEGLVLTEFGRN